MRNLKKVLALVLALVMAMSLVTIANAADFSDNADIDYSEAVDVMVAAGIIDGVGNNSFDPNGTLTREQAAKLITYMLMGENSNKLGVESSSFNDVAVTRWSAPAIEYCVSLGIIDGAGDGNFYPTGKLTGYAFAKMLLTAIGYDSQLEGFTGAGWTIPVATITMDVGLDDGLETMFGSAELTREEAAQMALNAIQTPLVKYDKQATISVNGAEISMGDAEASYVTTTIAKTQTISKRRLTNTNEYTIEFGEKYLTKLERKTANDDFGRPSYTWSYDKKDIGTYVDRELLHIEYTAEVTGEMLYNDIGSSTLKDANVTVYIDGVDNASINSAVFGKGNIVKSNTKKVGATGNGTLTQVFIDTEGDEADITIAVVNTYLAKAAEDYNDRDEDIDLNVYGIGKVADFDKKNPNYLKNVDRDEPYETITVKNDDIDVSAMKEDDIVLVTVAQGAVQTIEAPEVIADSTISSFKLEKYVTANDTKYDYSDAALYDEETLDDYDIKNMKDLTYNVYLDKYGYAIGVEKNEEPDQYVFVTGVDGNGSNFSSKNADVNVIFTDGTMKVIEVNVKDSKPSGMFAGGAIINTWCTYSVDKNDVYTLEQVDDTIANKVKVAQSAQNITAGTTTIDKKHVSLNSGTGFAKVYGNDDTVYINVELEMINSATSFAQTDGNGKLTAAPQSQTNYIQTDSTAQTNAAIINDVESVTVGVKNTSLDIKNVVKADYDDTPGKTTEMAVPLNEIYTLYKDNGYVIAAVVIGDNGGVSSSYAYITGSDYSKESYNSTEDEWTWSLEAVVDGKLVDLNEVGSTVKYLDEMAQGNWYEIKYDAKGNVRGYKTITWQTADGSATDPSTEYITEVVDVEHAVEDHDTVLLSVDYKTSAGKLTYRNGTLYTKAGPSEGFSVSPSVNSVVALAALKKSGAVNPFDDVTDGYEGYKGLEKAIRDLDDNFKGELNVLFEDGVATVIILNDTTGTAVDEGEEEIKPVAGKYSSEVDTKIETGLDKLALDDADNNKIDADGKTLKLNVYGGGDVATQIEDALAALGYTDITMSKTGTKYSIKAKKGKVVENLECTVGTNTTTFWIVDINGEKQYIQDNTAPAAIAKGTSDKGTGFAKSTDGGKTWTYDKAYGSTPSNITADTIIKSGYVTVTYAKAGSDVSDGVVATDVAAPTGDACVASGETITVTVKVTKNSSTAATAASYVTLADGTASADSVVTGGTTGKQTVTAADYNAGDVTLTWTVKAGEKAIALTATLSAS